MFNFFKKRSLPPALGLDEFTSLLSSLDIPANERLGAVYSAISVISTTISSLSLQMFKEDEKGIKTLAKAHPLYKLLKYKPNPYMSAAVLLEALVNNMLIYGVGYLHPRKNALGEVLELELLSPEDVSLAKKGGDYYYLVRGKELDFNALLAFSYYTNDGINAKSPLELCKSTLDLAWAIENHALNFFKNGAFPAGVVSFDGQLSDEAFKRIKTGWENSFSKDKAFKTAILEAGGKYTNISVDAQKSQLSELKAHIVLDIARLYKIPPHKMGDLSNASFSNIEQSETNFMTGTINPILIKIESVLNAFLIKEEQRGEYYFKFNANSILRADASTRMNNYVKAIQNGIFSINEVRAMEEKNPIEGGDEHYINLGQGSVGDFQGIQNQITQEGEAK